MEKLTVKKVFDLLKEEVKLLTQKILLENGLHDNDNIFKQVKVKTSKDGLEIYLNEYIKFIESGRGKYKKKVPISALLRFIRKRKIVVAGINRNRLAYMIQAAIFKNGIKGKPKIQDEIGFITADFITNRILTDFEIEVDNNLVVPFFK